MLQYLPLYLLLQAARQKAHRLNPLQPKQLSPQPILPRLPKLRYPMITNQELAFDSSDGSESDPYCISTADQLLLVNNGLTANYKLNADIDLSSLNGKTVIAGYTYEYVDMTTGDMDMSKTFSDVFDGNGHTLSNYTYKNGGNQMAVGIFGAVTAEGNGPVGLGGIAGGVAEITFDEGIVSGIDDKGNSIFSHEYEFCGYDETNGFYEYKSTDDNEDEFTYFCLFTDTFQIEFRYGSDLDELTNYTDGKYAYRMASGILKDCDEDMIRNSIELFCTENLAG